MSRKVSWKNVEDMMNAMNHFVQQVENFNRRCDEMEKRRLGHDPKKRLKPKEQLERNKPFQFDLSSLHSFPKTARAEVSPKKENVREEEQQKYDLSNVSSVEESSPEKEKPDSDFSDVFPKEENALEEDKQDSDFLDVSPKEENAPEEDKHDFDFSGVHPKEENVPEEEKHESDFSNVSPKEKNGLEEEKQNSEFSNVFPLKKNVQYSEEVVDFIIPIPIQTNHVLDLRTNLFQEEGNDMNPGRTSSNPNCARIGLVARARANEYYGELSMLIRVFWAEFNSWRPIELNYSQWGLFKAFRQLNTLNLLGTLNLPGTINSGSDSRSNLFEEGGDDMSLKHEKLNYEDGAKEVHIPEGPITRSKARALEEAVRSMMMNVDAVQEASKILHVTTLQTARTREELSSD